MTCFETMTEQMRLERGLVLAPRGRDAALAAAILGEAGLVAACCTDLAGLVRELRLGVGFVVITEEAIRGADLHGLAGWVASQPSWSDLPFLVLTDRGGGLERNPGALRLMGALGNVMLLERPFHPTILAAAARTALRSRRRQYQARAQLEELASQRTALAASEERLRFALLAGRLGAWELDVATRELECSEICKANFGRPSDQPFSYPDLVAAIHAEDRVAMQAAVARAIEEDADYAMEYRVVWPDESVHWVEMRGRVLHEHGCRTRMAGISQDITERKRAEMRRRALVELGDCIRDLNDPKELSFAAAEVLGRTLGVSRAGYGTVDSAAETITIERDWNAPGTQSLAGVHHFRNYGTYIEDIKRGETVVCSDAETDPRTFAAAGALKAINAQSFINMPLTEQGGLVALLYLNHATAREWPASELAFVRDVAERTRTAVERRRAEQDLRDLAASLERLVEERTAERDRVWRNSRDVLVIIGADRIFQAVNPAWTAILGHRPEDVVGRSFLDFVWPDDADMTRGGLDAAALEEDLTNFENRYRHKNGTPRWISWHTATEGGLIYAYGRHITAEKIAATELAAAQEQLRQAQKMEAIGQLTGGIAHDFNNLLTGIAGSLELMQTRLAQGRTTELGRYATAAMTSVTRAAALTHRLLAFARRQALDPRPTNVNKLVAGMEELIRRTVGTSIALEMVLAAGLWATLCDANQLESALLNLCINARDAMLHGGRLTVETANAYLDEAYVAAQRDVQPGQYVALSVTDTGTGMPASVIARAFEPFFTTKPIGQGTGLGLSMLYGFVKQSGGHVRIYSEERQGTTVRLYLPRHHGPGTEAGLNAASAAETPRAQAGETVLVVEDEPVVRTLIVEVLSELGYAALEAADGPAGLRVIHSDVRLDLLVTDVGLPGMNGRQLADAAREWRPELKVLFITGYAHNAAIGNGVLEPGMELIGKPFALDALAAKIRAMIEA